MKKRMIAWLLCACMTFTAAPEMLLADVAAKGQQTQEDEKSAGTGQTETETDRLEEEDQNSEKLTEEKEEIENQEQTEITEETETTESESTEETVETELTEETEGIEESEVSEETEVVTEETESIELTAEEQEQIEQEIIDEISVFSASSSYNITEEQLYMLAPSYLNNKAYDDIIAKCGDMSLEAINSVSATDETVASFMYSIKTGSSVLWSEFWSKCNLGDNTYESFEKQAARKVVYEYLQANQNLTKTAGEVEKNLKVVNKVYDFLKDKDKEAYRKTLVENNKNKLLSDEKIGEMVDGLYENMDMFMKFTNDTNEIFLMVSGMIEIQEIEVQAIDDLMIIHEHVKDPSIYNELIALRNEIVENPAQYIVDHYMSDKVLSVLQKEAKKAAGSIVSGVFDYSSLPWGIVNKAAGMIASVYECYNPSVSDIVYSSLLYQYWMDSNRAVAHYQHLFYTGKGTTDDMRYLEAAVNFNAACTKMLLSKSKNLVKSRDKRLYSKMDCWESSMGSEVNYELYINSCLSNATKAVKDGTLTIKDDSATIRDNNGNVIDENYDSTASIKAKFAAIQSQYKPNVGQTWNGDWGGAIQCFGFARMVFYQLFGCNMPNRYYGNAKYKYQSEENVDLVGQISGSSVTTDSAKNLLQQGKLGDIIQACGSGNGGQHTMVFVSADDNGVTVYDCNARLSASEPACVIHQWTIKWSTWASYYGSGDSSSENGISLYRASNYAQIYGDGDGMFYDDSVNFVIENGVLKKYNGWQTFVEIPDTVTSIGDEAFKNNTSMVSVSIPDSVKSIGDSAFYGCTSLLGVVIPDSVEKTGRCAFQKCSKLASAYLPVNEKFTYMNAYMFESCTSLKKIEIPDNVTGIDGAAFAECKKLSDVVLSKNLKTMGWQVFGNDNKLTEIEIPKSLEECRYYRNNDSIDGGTFDNCANLKTVMFEDGTTEIAEGLFAGCTGIEQITIPDTVTVIESGAFGGCINLKEIVVPDNVTEIQSSAFEYCSSLKTVKLSENLERIGVYAFGDCDVLKSIKIPDSVLDIDGAAFAECKELSDVVLSKNLKTMGWQVFGNDNKLTEIEIPKSLEECRYYRNNDSIDGGTFDNCANLKTVMFEDGTTEIAEGLFAGCTGIEQITIPDTVTVIESGAFGGCINLKEIVVPDNVTEIQSSAFEYCSSLKTVKLSENLERIGVYAFGDCDVLKSIKIPDSVLDIDGAAFAECKELSDVVLSKNLKTMGWQVFGNDNKLTEIEIPKSLEECRYYRNNDSIDGGTFDNCANLKTVTFEERTTEIAEGLFAGCTGIEQIRIPDTVTVIESGAFGGCINLKEIDVPNSVTEIQRSAFEYCSSLKTAKLSENLKSIGMYSFNNCTSLTEVHLSDILKEIPSNTFSGCKKLTTINFPSTLTTIGDSAFYGCESLPEAILPSGVEKIESNAFKNCKSLKKAVVPDTVSSIGSSAFYGCEALTDITLGSKLKKIDSQTFYGCTALPSIVIPYNVTTIGDSAFVNCTKLTQITVPRNTTSIESNAFSYPRKMTMYGPSGCYAQTYANGKGIKYVAQDIHATSIRLDITNKTAEYYDEFQLTATIAPQNFTDAVTWTSSNEDVATVSDTGYVEVCGVGTAVITVTAGNVKAACTVTVPQLIDWIEFDEDEIELKSGETYQLRPDISPSNATNKKLKYTSSDTKVAEVSASGLVTAKSEGEARIRAAATDGSDEYAVCYVTVAGKAKVTGITLNQTSATLGRGKKLALKAAISPSYASNKKVVWKSANTKVATVDGSGNVTAKAPGRTKITVTSAENSSYQASCTVTVPYNITYKLNKGKNNASNPSTYYGKKITLKNPSRKGYTFAGWYTDAKFKKKIKTIESSAKCDYTLYAKWTKVNVAKVSITSAKNSKSKQILLKYKKISGIKGYEISYSTDKKFKKAVTRKNTTKTSYTISKLKKGKTYYVRIRAYKVDSTGKKVYGKYTSVKKVKVSK
ncbi:leucine-rich repeat protein [Roseburia intestinalis]|nr:leucine-rich repeat protein [Roseburia intestinalis]